MKKNKEVQEARLQKIIINIRQDITQLQKMQNTLIILVVGDTLQTKEYESVDPPSDKTKKWIMDDLLDKIYDVEIKVTNLYKDLGESQNSLEHRVNDCQRYCADLCCVKPLFDYSITLSSTHDKINKFISEVERMLSELKRKVKKEDLDKLEDIKTYKYAVTKRKKFVTARDEVQKAIDNLKDNPEDVFNHLRSAIEFVIKEKFKIERIYSLSNFFKDAKKQDFPLPSYDLIYHIIDGGNKRVHRGEIHPEFEAGEAIRIVSDLIEEFQILDVSKTQFEQFKKNTKSIK